MRELIFEPLAWKNLKEVCEAGYPKEVCGLLLGKEGGHTVERIEVLNNILAEKSKSLLDKLFSTESVALPSERLGRGGAFEFLIDPGEYQKKLSMAQIFDGLDQIGIFHSHPDHPAEPSATDVSQPMLAGWSNIIVAVHRGKVAAVRSWFREDEGSAFQEERILL